MKLEKRKIKRMFFEPNGDFKLWVLLVIDAWFVILAVWVLLEISS